MNVLFLSCSLDTPGGVSAFARMMLSHASPEVNFDHFIIGARPGKRARLLRVFQPLVDGMRLVYLVRRKRYEAAHINPSLNLKSILRDSLYLLIVRAMGIRNVLVFFHGWSQGTQLTIRSNGLLKKLFKSVLAKARYIGVLSRRFRDELIEMGLCPEKIVVFTTMFDGEAITIDAALRKHNDQLLFMSRLVREKGCYETLQAFQLLRPKYPALRLIIAGDGPEMKSLMQLSNSMGLQQSVKFLGYIGGTEKAKVLNEAGILVFPTYYGEGCPIILLEAMGAGMAIVTSTDGGIADVLENGRDALLLEALDPDSVAAAVDSLLSDLRQLEKMQRHNHQRAWDHFEAGIVSRNIQKFYGRTPGSGQMPPPDALGMDSR